MLDGPLLLPPLLLAGLLLLSAGAKVAAPEETLSAIAQLRLPGLLRTPFVARALPLGELALAVALLVLPGGLGILAAVAAALLFVVYLVVIVRALTFGYPVTCSCFGRLGLGEVTRQTAVRNALLVVLALLAVVSATSDRSVAARLLDASGPTWAWIGVSALVAGVLVATFAERRGGELPAAPPTPAVEEGELLDYVRQPIPYGMLEDDLGRPVPLHTMTRSGAWLLVFISPGCGACREVIAALPRWASELPITVRAVAAQPVDLVLSAAPELTDLLLHDPAGRTAKIFALPNPGAVLLGGDGLLAGGPVVGAQAVQQLVADIQAELAEAATEDPDVTADDVAPQTVETKGA